MMKVFVFLLLAAVAIASPLGYFADEENNQLAFEEVLPALRYRRDLRIPDGAGGNPGGYGTQVHPHISKQDGTTNVGATVVHKQERYDVEANWNKNVRGPGRAKPDWHIKGTYRW